jgi:hypothetical protein
VSDEIDLILLTGGAQKLTAIQCEKMFEER